MRKQRSPEEKAAREAAQKRSKQLNESVFRVVLDGKGLPRDLSERVDKWIADQGSELNRFEAIRRLVELGLKK